MVDNAPPNLNSISLASGSSTGLSELSRFNVDVTDDAFSGA